ncbi:FAD-dependent oxidoreductase [Microbacterium azadirachtae]|uniref:Pentachlorophenol 4-monooxygenase n=1 Tax=Microbacterium azadirachtae TaxID=582680 RepID=A0A0F0LJU6_9MICO|nr:NAD(P)/FAD-dependent oxidoreductase [Microbacterium azadirachtae]KJL32585.1 Pentachlorophenol 4-monooxygenase [Microbacterium azadirachtae]
MSDPEQLLVSTTVLDHDVVIVGAGPVGMLLACLLAQDGIDVVVCERRRDEDPRSRAIGIHAPGLEMLDRAGVGAAARAASLALEGGDVLSRGRVLASLDFSAHRPVRVLPQQRTHALLRERLQTLSAGALHPGCSVRAVRDEGEFVRLAVDRPAGRQEVTAAFVVLADGVHSTLRRELGFEWRRRPGRAAYTMADVPDPAAGVRAQLHCEPGGIVEAFPLPGGMRRWVLRGGGLHSGAEFRIAIAERIGREPAIGDEVRPTGFVAAQHLSRTVARGRVALLGDAAHEISPIGGQGMNLGWVNAGRLAAALRTALVEGDRDLGGYAHGALRAARAAQRRSAFYMTMGAPAQGVPLATRETLIRVLGSGPLRSWASGLVTMRGF